MKKFNKPKTTSFALKAKKSLGQNFLKDVNVINGIVDVANQCLPAETDPKVCHEIGPGSGALTGALLKDDWSLQAVEKDERAFDGLRNSLQVDYPKQFSVLNTDVLQWEPHDDYAKDVPRVLMGNIPYYITSDILLWYIRHIQFYQAGIFMVQKEVGERLCAKPGTKSYGRLTVRLQLQFDISMEVDAPAECFVPQPKVDSCVVLLKPNGFQYNSPEEELLLEKLTNWLFSARRKMIRKTVLQFGIGHIAEDWRDDKSFWEKLEAHGILPTVRPDAISVKQYLSLLRVMVEHYQG